MPIKGQDHGYLFFIYKIIWLEKTSSFNCAYTNQVKFDTGTVEKMFKLDSQDNSRFSDRSTTEVRLIGQFTWDAGKRT